MSVATSGERHLTPTIRGGAHRKAKVVIADDHEIVRIGLRTILANSHDGYEVVGEAADGRELMDVLARHPCDILIVDFLMPESDAALDGIHLLRELRRHYAQLPIIVLTMLRNVAIFRAAYSEGAKGVVEKESMVGELLNALRVVRAGSVYMSDQMRGTIASAEGTHATHEGTLLLTNREAEVVRMLVQGMSISEIADRMHRSIKTISGQKHSAMTKLGIKNERQLFEYARIHGLW